MNAKNANQREPWLNRDLSLRRDRSIGNHHGCIADVLIVGGGPAGLAAAIALAEKGIDVLVADALRPPIDKACGEGLMPDARGELAKLGIRLLDSDGVPFEGISFHSERAQVAAHFTRGAGMGLRRLRLHTLLADRAVQAGVRLAWGSPVEIDAGIDDEMGAETGTKIRSGIPVRVDGRRCAYRYLIGADGQASRVRAAGGLDRGTVFSRRFGSRRHFRIRPWSSMVEVYWGELGQAYVTPVAPDELCIATVARSSAHRMDDVLQSLPLLSRRLASAAAVSRLRGGLTETRRQRRVTAGNLALVGDASGSVDAVTGEGLGLGFRQASLLAGAIAQDNLALYQAAHPESLRVAQAMSRVMLSMDARPWWRERALAALAGNPTLFSRMLKTHLGEETLTGFLWENSLQLAAGICHAGWLAAHGGRRPGNDASPSSGVPIRADARSRPLVAANASKPR